MDILKENKAVIVIIVIIGVILLIYGFSGSGSGGALLTSQNGGVTGSVDERNIIRELNILKDIRLDGHIFQDPAYMSLHDFSRQIVPEPVGRPDPFAPLPKTQVTVSGGGEVLLRE